VSINLEAELIVVCTECGAELSVDIESPSRFGLYYNLKVEPCEHCMANKKEEGEKEGRDVGYDEGFEKGVAEGEHNAALEKDTEES
jgi:hypothetical protein